jgi:hypothetical protein
LALRWSDIDLAHSIGFSRALVEGPSGLVLQPTKNRRTYRVALAAGVPVPVVSERLCHARTSTTVNIYAHAMPGADRDAANLLADILHT